MEPKITEKYLNISDFSQLYKNNNQELDYYKDILKYFEASIGGCSCSKKSRQEYANYKFIDIISSSNDEQLSKIKLVANAHQIKLVDMHGNIFKEI